MLRGRPAADPSSRARLRFRRWLQRLHGMGELLYDEAQRRGGDFPPVRVYAPVGPHKELLGYLVRRLLENGANSSFVNRFLDDAVPLTEVVRDPLALAEADSSPHPRIPLPSALFGAGAAQLRGTRRRRWRGGGRVAA